MQWIKANERLPEVFPDESKSFYCRHIKDGDKKILWYGKSSQSFLSSEPWNWEWLDESITAPLPSNIVDQLTGIRDKLYKEYPAGEVTEITKPWYDLTIALLRDFDVMLKDISSNPLSSTTVEALEQANPYSGEDDLPWEPNPRDAWNACCAKLRELLSSQPGAKNQVVAFGKGLNEMANGIRAAVIKEAIHVVGKSLIPHHNVVTPILQEIIKELMTLNPLPQPSTGVNTDVLSLLENIKQQIYNKAESELGEFERSIYFSHCGNLSIAIATIKAYSEILEQFNTGKGQEQEEKK